jgi:hypothetical protein
MFSYTVSEVAAIEFSMFSTCVGAAGSKDSPSSPGGGIEVMVVQMKVVRTAIRPNKSSSHIYKSGSYLISQSLLEIFSSQGKINSCS